MALTCHTFWQKPGLSITVQQAEDQGWAIFDVQGRPFVQALDELGVIDDEEAIIRARLAGLDVADSGLVRMP